MENIFLPPKKERRVALLRNKMRLKLAMVKVLVIVLVVWLAGSLAYALPLQAPHVEVLGIRQANGKLKLDVSQNELYQLDNLNPGDVREAKLTITNKDYDECVKLYLRAQVIKWNANNDEGKPSIFDEGVLQIRVLNGSEQLYPENNGEYGPIPEFGSGAEGIFLGTLCKGKSKDLHITVRLDGPNTGNEYQGETAQVQWVLVAAYEGEKPPVKPDPDRPDDRDPDPGPTPKEEIEVPPEEPPAGKPEVPEEPVVEVPPEGVPAGPEPTMPKTGEESHLLYYLLGGLALLAGTQITYPRRRS